MKDKSALPGSAAGASPGLTPVGGLASHPFHRHHQAVAAARHRLHVLRLFRRVPQRQAQLLDGGVDAVVELHNRVIRPELLTDLLPDYPYIIYPIDNPRTYVYTRGLLPTSRWVEQRYGEGDRDSEFGNHKS